MTYARSIAKWRVWLLLLVLTAGRSDAVILLGTGDPEANTTAPTGALTNSGWQFMGQWGLFTGMPVSGNCFITARHVGGVPGQSFALNGRTYPALQVFDDPGSDLKIVRILGTFPQYAPLYSGTNETGASLMVFGRGTQRGSQVESTSGQAQGWFWGPADSRLRWGQNTVAGIFTDTNPPAQYLLANFSASGSANEATLSSGDSGGAVFILDSGNWKLAGVNSAVDGPYNTGTNGPGFFAALFDTRGLYTLDENTNWVAVSSRPFARGSSFYATRVSSRIDWINSIITQAVSSDCVPVLEGSSRANGGFVSEPAQTYDANQLTISIPVPANSRFYRLKGCAPLTLSFPIMTNGVIQFSIGAAYPP